MKSMYEEVKSIYLKHIGKKVIKFSGKPFKSLNKINTIKDIVKHPVLKDRFAYTFEEDDSAVEISRCKVV